MEVIEATEREIVIEPLTPEARAIGAPKGTPIVLADGGTWIVADELPYLGGIWDRLYEDNVARHQYQTHHLATGLQRLLQANYRLSDSEAFGLVQICEWRAMILAIERAMFGPPPKEVNWTWGDWIVNSFLANGIDPASVPPSRFLQVMAILTETKHAIPEDEAISVQVAMAKRSALLNFTRDH